MSLSCLCHCWHRCQACVAEHLSLPFLPYPQCPSSCECAIVYNTMSIFNYCLQLHLVSSESISVTSEEQKKKIIPWDFHPDRWFCSINLNSVTLLQNQIIRKTDDFCYYQDIDHQRCFLEALTFPRGLPKICHGLPPSIFLGFLLSSDFSPVFQLESSFQLLPHKRTKSSFHHDLPWFS